jgi:hypothetical protein
MNLNVPTRNARLTCATRRSYQSMNHIQLLASSVTARCRRFTQFLISNLRVKDSTQQIQGFRNAVLTSTYSNGFDRHGTLRARAHQGLRASRLRLTRSVALAIGISLCLPMSHASSGSIEAIEPKHYIRLVLDKREAVCLIKLYGKESAFNPYAIGNLSGKYHTYGIPQMKNALIYDKSPIEQVRYGLKYIDHRYNGDTCKAWTHWLRVGWH